MQMRKLLGFVFAATVMAGCDDKPTDPALQPKTSNRQEWIAQSPKGKLSPVFYSEGEVKRYANEHSDQFPSGTVILER